jgi:hypothetical protein
MARREPTLPEEPAGALTTVTWEQDERYLPQALTDVPWFWQPIYAPGDLAYTLPLTDAQPGPITVTVRLWSHTNFPPYPDHRLVLHWDGKQVGEKEWGGQGMQAVTASWVEETALGEHTLTLETPATSEKGVAVVWIDGIDVTYRKAVTVGIYRAEGAAISLTKPEERVLDVTDPWSPVDLGTGEGTGRVATEAGGTYWVGTPEVAQVPKLRPAQELAEEGLAGVEYLAIAPPDYQDALRPLLDAREEGGLITAVVTPQSVYDALGTGRPDPKALQALVRSLPSLRYLLLVGDASVQPWAYDEGGNTRVVAPFVRTAVLGETAADGLLGTDEAGEPIVAVGRLPAESPSDVTAMVEKTLLWEEGPLPTPVLVSDDEGEFTTSVEEFALLIPGGQEAPWVDLGEENSRESLFTALSAGPAWLTYNGHGSLTRLGDEAILTVEDGNEWDAPMLGVAWTCLAAHYTHPQQISMAEAWLRRPEGGVVAFIGPVGETTTFEQRPFAEAFYRAVPEVEHLGDAWLRALQIDGGSDDVRWGFALLGDPALPSPVE